jgi:uncharacterized membrane-anchored protein YitT (DUF2179 family)
MALTRRKRLALVWQFLLLVLGSLISAVGVIVFQLPFDIAPGGVSGVAVILNELFGLPVGMVVLLGNVPIQILAARILGGWRSVAVTVLAVFLYSVMLDGLTPRFPPEGVSGDVLLNSIYAGIIGGIGGGLIFRAGGTLGGTSTLGRILQQRYGIPLSSSTLYTDGLVIAAAGLVFGWEAALYAMITLFIGGAVSDYVLEGPAVVRTAVVITDKPHEVADVILTRLGRGVTGWEAQGMFTGQTRTVLYVTILRAQVGQIRGLILSVDPKAFVVIGQAHSAYGQGFRETRSTEIAE